MGWITAVSKGPPGFVTLGGLVAITVVRAMEGCVWWSLAVRWT